MQLRDSSRFRPSGQGAERHGRAARLPARNGVLGGLAAGSGPSLRVVRPELAGLIQVVRWRSRGFLPPWPPCGA